MFTNVYCYIFADQELKVLLSIYIYIQYMCGTATVFLDWFLEQDTGDPELM